MGALVAALLLASVEACLHTDWFLYKYRAVFAAGRAMDKILAVEQTPPQILVLGNSRVDNSIIPNLLSADAGVSAFNLGIPGAEACNLEGVTERLARNGLFDNGKVEQILIGLDESILQLSPGLGYSVFFDERQRLWQQRRYLDWSKSWLRLWGYADSLKTLQEPAKLLRFLASSRRAVEPWGGSARDNLGHRAADDVQAQDAGQIDQQEAASSAPPDPMMVDCLWATVARIQDHGAEAKAFFPPVLNRLNSFAKENPSSTTPYQLLKREFTLHGLGVIELDTNDLRKPEYFANAGHLNRRGAEIYTAMLSAYLQRQRATTAMP